MSSRSPGTPPGTISRLQLGSLGKKSHLDVASVRSCREYYMGEGGGFPQVRAVVCIVVQSARGLSPHPRVSRKCELTTLWFVLMQIQTWSTKPSSYSNPWAPNSTLYPFLELEAGSVPPSLNFSQLDFVEPSSGFHPVTWERITYALVERDICTFQSNLTLQNLDILGNGDMSYVLSYVKCITCRWDCRFLHFVF
jgi:hypothetical protein